MAAGGWSGVADGGDALYVGSMEGQIVALDPETGARRASFPEERDRTAFGAIYGTPTVAEGRVYVAGFNGKVYSLSTGTLQEEGTPFEVDSDELSKGIASAVVVTGNTAVVGAAESSGAGRLYVLDAQTLREVCRFPARGAEPIGKVWSTPAVADGVAYFGDLSHHMYAVSLEDCTLRWSAPVKLGGGIGSTPLLLNGQLYVGAFNRTFYSIEASTGFVETVFEADGWFWSGIATDGKLLFVPSMDGYLYAVDPRSRETHWKFNTKGAILSTPVVVDGQVVVASDAKILYVLDIQTGDKVWEYPLDGQVRSPLMAIGDVVYVNTMAHTVDALDVKTGRSFWRQASNTKE